MDKMLAKKGSKPPKKSGNAVADFANNFAYSLGLDPEILTSQFNVLDLLNSTEENKSLTDRSSSMKRTLFMKKTQSIEEITEVKSLLGEESKTVETKKQNVYRSMPTQSLKWTGLEKIDEDEESPHQEAISQM